jgi:hypothetical protein
MEAMKILLYLDLKNLRQILKPPKRANLILVVFQRQSKFSSMFSSKYNIKLINSSLLQKKVVQNRLNPSKLMKKCFGTEKLQLNSHV